MTAQTSKIHIRVDDDIKEQATQALSAPDCLAISTTRQ